MSHAISSFPVGGRFGIILFSVLSAACGGGSTSDGLAAAAPTTTQSQNANPVQQQPTTQQPAPDPAPQPSSSNATTARFNNPTGITVQANGIVYVADSGNQTIRKIVQGKTVTTIAGTPGVKGSADGVGAAAQFNNPSAMTADAAGNLYVTDTYNHTIRKITPSGVISTLSNTAGRATAQSATIDSDIASATFINPLAIAADSAGGLYISDGYFLPPEPNFRGRYLHPHDPQSGARRCGHHLCRRCCEDEFSGGHHDRCGRQSVCG